ncbi:hypothetical protein BC826DRAFT_1176046 [Russula brevipes]|nr:hypothetical protein BC826DRAFT_1176046 [Russula brevipes]
MMLDAVQTNQADDVAMCDSHPDLEVFRLRLGKALNYECKEVLQTGLFSRRDPREEGGPGLNTEQGLIDVRSDVSQRSLKRWHFDPQRGQGGHSFWYSTMYTSSTTMMAGTCYFNYNDGLRLGRRAEPRGACKRMRYNTARYMVEMARHMLAVEKGWLLSRIGLIDDCGDDVTTRSDRSKSGNWKRRYRAAKKFG